MERQSTKRKNQFRLMLHGRVLMRDSGGEIIDVTHREIWGLKKFADSGATAVYILSQVMKRLELLSLAAEHRSKIDASLVRRAVEDIQIDLEQGSEIAGYLFTTQMLFKYSKGLPPPPPSKTRGTGRSLTILKPVS